ncbi:adenylate/guanylate cyclase domain-containing protein [Armatimonas rosea]|uniref:Putative ATPase/class 3 adenylate cyclase n=1 Tax=Armatimonas rosea TaxID=685828 RepID=A0A7W9W7F9_ARMRO|nr:adenylate/guanylate cyclase domain-containing protein [Armatimonas rosea]MBB6051618.1 putative ATPase/class 3 adenylate cyclase [Armatimonas rosea]
MPILPAGTVTFLFTDIEGSTRLWEEHPERMRTALARHDALLHQAITEHNGYVFKTIGDAFCAAFATAPEALSAALTAQRCLYAEPWEDGIALRARMALHTGAVESRDNDYFGQPLNRVARLLATGYGGQVLLSQATQELVRDSLPAQTTLLNLGEHRLRDLSRPEHIYQVLHPELLAEFPTLRSLDSIALPNNLPQEVTSFIGRKREMEEIKSLLATTSLLTLTGSGGCGKTRLSLQVAAEVLEHYPQGVWLVELAPLTNPALVPQMVAEVLGVRESPGETLTKSLQGFLKGKQLLLVLDNCEHVLESVALLGDTLLRSCPSIRMLASSREALGISGESTYRIPSLSLPQPSPHHTPESLSQFEAVRLFLERATTAKPDFLVTNENAPALASVCYRLDGIPLAIELAAARLRAMPIEQLEDRLDNRFRLLTGGSRTALPRQQTLRALIDWSFDLLTPEEKTLLLRLSVFAGGWVLESAESVGSGAGIDELDVLDLLTSLVDKSLVTYEEHGNRARYRLLETVRQYARERLAESGESETVRGRHLDHTVTQVEAIFAITSFEGFPLWMQHMDEEYENIRAALAWCSANASSETFIRRGLRIGEALWPFWHVCGYLSDGREHLEELARLGHAWQGTRPRTVVKSLAEVLHGTSLLAMEQGDDVAAGAALDEALQLAHELEDQHSIAVFGMAQGWLANHRGDYNTARQLIEKNLSFFREINDPIYLGLSLVTLGGTAIIQNDFLTAEPLIEESMALFRSTGNTRALATGLEGLGNIAAARGDYVSAQSLLREGVAMLRAQGNRHTLKTLLRNLSEVECVLGNLDTAQVLIQECLTLCQQQGNKQGTATALEGLGAVLVCREKAYEATLLWGAAQKIHECIGFPKEPFVEAYLQKWREQARLALGDTAFAAAIEEGSLLTEETVIAQALQEATPLEGDDCNS